MVQKKMKIAVIFGGRSGEHEVSLISAASVIRHLDRSRFEVIPISIDKQGRWGLNQLSLIDPDARSLVVQKDAEPVLPAPYGQGQLVPLGAETARLDLPQIDVVFPVLHGPLGEDGTIQGLLELSDLPYVGCGVLASAVGMDKDVAKRLVRDAGLPIVPYVTVKKVGWQSRLKSISEQIDRTLGYPCFVKPANMGSSVGVHKVRDRALLEAAMADSFQYDLKILVEKAIDAREIEFAVLENPDDPLHPSVSVAGEIIPHHEFYSYEAKYIDENGAGLKIPAPITPEQFNHGQALARSAFIALECEGMARCDLFLDRKSGEFYFNEVNTIPGFTHISMYPKMWEATGIPYAELLTRLIDLAVIRQGRKSALSREYVAQG